MNIDSIVFSSNNDKYTKLQNVVEGLFKRIENIAINEGPKEELTNDEWTDIINICKEFTMEKYYISTDDASNSKIISRSKIVKLFWQYAKKLIDRLFELLWKIILNVVIDYDQFYKANLENFWKQPGNVKPVNEFEYHMGSSFTFLTYWKKFLNNWDNGLELLNPIIRYTYLNYPRLVNKEIENEKSFIVLINRTLMDNLIYHINENGKITFHRFLKCFLIELTRIPIEVFINQKGIFNDTPLRLAFKYNYLVPINDEHTNIELQKIDIRTFYLTTMDENLLEEHFFDLNYPKSVFDRMEQIAFISSVVSPTLIEPMNEIFITKILMSETIFTKQFPYLIKYASVSEYTKNIVQFIDNAYYFRGQTEKFDELLLNNMVTILKEKTTVDSEFTDIIKVVDGFNKIIDCYTRKPEDRKHIFKSLIRFFGSEVKFWEKYCKYIIKTLSYKSYLQILDLSFKVSILLGYAPMMKNVYSKLFFRKLLFDVDIFMNNEQLVDADILKRILPYSYTEDSDSIYENIIKLQKEIKENVKSILRYEQNEENFMTEEERSIIKPLIFKKDNVPDGFHMDTANDKIKLPNFLQDKWDTYLNECSIVDISDNTKKITPVYNLQHCEITSPFVSCDGTPLIFQLTVYQTTVLCEFNENDKVNFATLIKKYQLTSKMLKDVLNSFLNIKLIKINEDKTFSLNEDYIPDENKVKMGKLRVSLPKMTIPANTPPFSRTNTANTSFSSSDRSNLDPEGSNAVWQRELISAQIIKCVKPERLGVTQEQIITRVQDVMVGTSVGECKDALERLVRDKYVVQRAERYFYV